VKSFQDLFKDRLLKHLFFIALGGGLGATLRYIMSKGIQSSFNTLFPMGTLAVNVTGSLIMGFLFYLFSNIIAPGDLKSFLTIGFLGALTTFSTYSLETVNLLKDGEIKLGLLNFLINNVVCMVMVIIGIIASKYFLKIIK
jgi:CrcB protein